MSKTGIPTENIKFIFNSKLTDMERKMCYSYITADNDMHYKLGILTGACLVFIVALIAFLLLRG